MLKFENKQKMQVANSTLVKALTLTTGIKWAEIYPQITKPSSVT